MCRAPLLVLLALGTLAGMARGENWPAWRGPLGIGISSERDLPTEWSPERNITWKAPLAAEGNSTPIVWNDRVFLTAPLDRGRQRAVLCFDRQDGRLLWQQAVTYAEPEPTHNTNPYCSASPVTDGERVIAWHGSAGVAAYDFAGQPLWHRDLGKFAHIWGNAASPVLHGGLVILHLGPGPRTLLAALDKKTGQTVWEVNLEGSRNEQQFFGSWSTPVLRPAADGPELLVSLPRRLAAFDPDTGRERWFCRGLTDLVYTSPVYRDDLVVAMSGYHGAALGCRAGGEGDVTDRQRLWLTARNQQRIGSAVLVGDHAYILNDPGDAQCLKLETGEEVWRERLGGKNWGSMVAADGKLYVIDMQGETFVLAASPTFKLLARNPLQDGCRASLAISDGQIFARTFGHLYCIGPRRQAEP